MRAAAVRRAPTRPGCDRGHGLTTRSSARSLAAGRRRDGIASHPLVETPYLGRPYSIVVPRVKARGHGATRLHAHHARPDERAEAGAPLLLADARPGGVLLVQLGVGGEDVA